MALNAKEHLTAESGVLSMAPSGASPGTYPSVTVDADGRVTPGANLGAGGLPGHTHTAADIVRGGVQGSEGRRRSRHADMGGLPSACGLRSSQKVPFLLYRQGARIEAATDSYLHRHHFEPDIAMGFDMAEAIKAMVAFGVEVSMLPL